MGGGGKVRKKERNEIGKGRKGGGGGGGGGRKRKLNLRDLCSFNYWAMDFIGSCVWRI